MSITARAAMAPALDLFVQRKTALEQSDIQAEALVDAQPERKRSHELQRLRSLLDRIEKGSPGHGRRSLAGGLGVRHRRAARARCGCGEGSGPPSAGAPENVGDRLAAIRKSHRVGMFAHGPRADPALPAGMPGDGATRRQKAALSTGYTIELPLWEKLNSLSLAPSPVLRGK